MDSRLEGMLEPIYGDDECGEDLSFSAEFDRIQEARREDDPTVDYGEWQTALKQADWPDVVSCCVELLGSRSKDLRLASWLTESLLKTEGLEGLANGTELMARLIERFGPGIHPQAEDGDQEQRIGTLSWFVMRMSQLVRQVPLTQASAGQFSFNDYESARILQNQLQRSGEEPGDLEDKVTMEKFSAAVAKTDRALYTAWLADAKRCRESVDMLDSAADVLFEGDGPSFSPLLESLAAVEQRLQLIARDLGLFEEEAVGSMETVGATDAVQSGQPAARVHQGPIKNREQALEMLRQVAVFFRNTEPHSPVAYLADKAAHWGGMPLHAWLRNVVKDNSTLSHIEELLGLEGDSNDR